MNIDSLISVSELQKLSLRRLRKMKTPLFVVDRKSGRRGFVILDLETFEHLQSGGLAVASRPARLAGETPDFRQMGLLWDRSGLSNKEFYLRLKDAGHPEHVWAMRRLLEYAPSSFVTGLLSLSEIKGAVASIRLRPAFQEAWNRAVHYWSKTAS